MNKRPTFIVHRPCSISDSSGESGVALVLTLSILALVTLLLIAFVTSMRVENAASKNYNEVIKARELAKGAIDQAVAQIRSATPQRGTNANPGVVVNYVTFPGGAYVSNNGGVTRYTLYSAPTSTDQTNLNSGLWITGGTSQGEFLPTNSLNSQINVGWMYIDQNGNMGPAPLGTGVPLMGRMAYWVDDEASKINVNTAGSPSSAIDMSVLLNGLGALAPSIVLARSPNPFTTIQEIERVNAAITNMFDDNRCEVTVYSNDANYPGYTDDLDVFDRQRVPLNPNTLNSTLNITGAGDVNGVGAFTRLSDPNLGYVCANGLIPKGFQGKCGVASGLSQLIANIIGYQINPNLTPPPDDGSVIPSAPAYLGLAATPLVNSVKIEYDITPAVPPAQPFAMVTRIVSVQLCYMYSGGYTNGNESIIITGLPVGNPVTFSSTVTISPADPNGIKAGGIIAANGVAVFSHQDAQIPFTSPITVSTPEAQVTYTRVYAAPHRLNFAQTGPITAASQPTLNPGVQALTKVYQGSDVIGDPAVNVLATGAEWQLDKTSSFPSAPSPDPKTVMRAAPMQSVGELGYIHLPASSVANPQWGYLTLQPNPTPAQMPDWALLDLFTVGAGTGGRININSLINPGLSPAVPAQPRLVPLEALLNSVGAAGVAGSIYADARTEPPYGMEQSGSVGIFDTIGEVCEIPSLATGANDAAKEAAIRGIASLITVRSSTFTIWVLTQSIKQPPNTPSPGTYNPTYDVITGEVRAQAVVERYENPPGSAPKYRLRYLRYL